MTTIVQFSGGAASFITAVLLQEEGVEIHLLFADTKMEDEDLYRFMLDAEKHLGLKVIRLADGRTPWQVFRDEKMMGNSRLDPCSKILKRQLLRRYMDKHYDPKVDDVAIGYDANEEHRFIPLKERYLPWRVRSPLIEQGIFREQAHKMIEALGIELPRLYKVGFLHNNCGGFCIKAGQGSFALLLDHFPERYAKHEAEEEAFREWIGRDVSILTDTRGGEKKPLTLRQLRERREKEPSLIDYFDYGGCACMEPVDDGE